MVSQRVYWGILGHIGAYWGILLVDNNARTKKTLGDRAFSIAAAKIWNNLLLNIRSQESFSVIKKLLKTHYFREAFNVYT